MSVTRGMPSPGIRSDAPLEGQQLACILAGQAGHQGLSTFVCWSLSTLSNIHGLKAKLELELFAEPSVLLNLFNAGVQRIFMPCP